MQPIAAITGGATWAGAQICLGILRRRWSGPCIAGAEDGARLPAGLSWQGEKEQCARLLLSAKGDLRGHGERQPSLLPLQIPGAHLIAKDLVLQSGTLSWDSNDRLTGVIMTSDFSYDDKTKELEVKRAGIYYVYIQLALKRVLLSDSEESNVTISIHRTWDNRSELSLTTHLKGETPDSVSKFSASLLSLHTGARLHVNLTVPHALHGWQLNEEKVNFFGLFRVAEAGR
ncbi:tumor necrosis factor ligand superfamily member 9 isoform X1 [Ornithorhynchus anatinus]|uniref:tumor necrosis factor ligand superfamily member 9 isoform X1 n=1 Tax=Ornithorhynchus anatinus TaxID=9258 RepID=UPI000155D457|nr:tumor necrosis factor ligand superfamily member 9 isoform X1 [Ornithorhynchus anatinus]